MNFTQVRINFIWTSREFCMKFIWNTNVLLTKFICLIFHTNFICILYQLHTNVLLISYQIKTSFIRNSSEYVLDISLEFHKKFIWISYGLHMNYPNTSCEFPFHYMGICASSHIIHMKFIWRSWSEKSYFIWMILTVRRSNSSVWYSRYSHVSLGKMPFEIFNYPFQISKWQFYN